MKAAEAAERRQKPRSEGKHVHIRGQQRAARSGGGGVAAVAAVLA